MKQVPDGLLREVESLDGKLLQSKKTSVVTLANFTVNALYSASIES